MDETRFQKGFTWNEYMIYLEENVEALKKEQGEVVEEYLKEFHKNFEQVLMSDEDITFLARIKSKLHVMALAEYWCSDARANLPVMARIAAINPNIELRIFPRDENLDLMNQYLFRGKSMSIPAFGFFDETFIEFGRWLGGKPKIMWDLIDRIGMEAASPKVREFYKENRGQKTLKEFKEILHSWLE